MTITIEKLKYLIKDNLKDNNHKDTILEQLDFLFKEKKYTEEDLRIALEYGYERGREGDFTSEQEEEFYKYLQPKTEWEVEIVNGKFKLK